MKIRNLFRTALVALLALPMVSCVMDAPEQDNRATGDGQEVTVSFNYSVKSLSGDASTRVTPGFTDDENIAIENMFIIQFDGNSTDSKMLGAPRFLDKSDLAEAAGTPTDPLPVTLIEKTSDCYTVFVANVREGKDYGWNLSTQSTFADVVKRVKGMAAEADAYEEIGPAGSKVQTLLMSAVYEGPVTAAAPLQPVFTRNVAKLTLSLSVDNADMVIKSIQLRNVSKYITMADAALGIALPATLLPDTQYPTDNISMMDYAAVTTGLPVAGEGATEFSWYVPRNQRGRSLSAAFYEKTFYAPAYATYFEIVAVKMNADGVTLESTCVFRVYPGADQINDYNILANHHYTVGLSVVNDGLDDNDSRVETFRSKDYTVTGEKSNSFIVNPAPAGGGELSYRIPITQVNRYWGNGGAGYEGYGNTPANVIGASDQWKVELLWCDTADLFGASTDTGKIYLTNYYGGEPGSGTGPDQFFELKVPAGAKQGNFVLGIKKGSSEILWSWHFWVTDYNPDYFNKALITPGKYIYTVPGGQVERYADHATTNPKLWDAAAAKYAGTVMMDRSLGAESSNYFSGQPGNSTKGLVHYQFGRKDPFTAVTGSPRTGMAHYNVAERVVISRTMATPTTFYCPGSNWTSEATGLGITWNDPQADDSHKSIYDPCPPGWRVPADGTWNDFNTQYQSAYINVINPLRDLAYGYGRNIGSVTSPVNGLRYWPSSDKTTNVSPVEGTIWYPATGYRTSTTGGLGSVGSTGYYWSDTPSSEANGRSLYFHSTSVYPQGNGTRAYGFSVRCVAEFQ